MTPRLRGAACTFTTPRSLDETIQRCILDEALTFGPFTGCLEFVTEEGWRPRKSQICMHAVIFAGTAPPSKVKKTKHAVRRFPRILPSWSRLLLAYAGTGKRPPTALRDSRPRARRERRRGT